VTKKRILILSAGFGDGHNTAAHGLAAALGQAGHEAMVSDVFDRAHPTLNEFLRKAYRMAITHTPKIWQLIYRSSDAADFTKRRFDVFAPSARALKSTLDDFEPDAVISTYPLYAHLVERLVGPKGHLPCPFISVVTDAQTINSIWFSSQSDHYSVIDEVSAQVLLDAGVPEAKVHVFGFPISPAFEQAASFVPDTPLKILYLPSTKKREVTATLCSLAECRTLPNRKITIALGRHYERLKTTVENAISNAPPGFQAEIIAWTDQMPTLLQTHHCVIGKAGGASVQEAMAARCPLLINYIVPGQEEGNAEAAINSGAARLITDPNALGAQISALLDDHRRGLKGMRSAAEKAGNPSSARQIVEFVLSKIPDNQ
jgi:processive 1,2-diacylglycerol beta-glucosyltransferase